MWRIAKKIAIPAANWRNSLLETIDATLFPTTCPICQIRTIGIPLCLDCRQELLDGAGSICPRCAMPVGPFAWLDGGCSACRGRPLGFDGAISLGPYQGPILNLCLRLKHQRDAWLAHWLSKLLVEARGGAIRSLIDAEPPGKTVVVAVPQHWTRRLGKSFYNQADTLAEELSRLLRLPLYRPLRRVKSTRKLAGLSRTERRKEMRNAFSAWGNRVKGRQVLLVDDILTSGATCGAAARALKRAGAKRVVVLVIARAEGNA